MRSIVLEVNGTTIDLLPIFGVIKNTCMSKQNRLILLLTVYYNVIQLFYATYCTQNKYTSYGTTVETL